MNNVNQFSGDGYLGRDARVGATATSGATYVEFSFACSKRWTGKDGNAQERTSWIPVRIYGKRAESLYQTGLLVKGNFISCTNLEFQANSVQQSDGSWRNYYHFVAVPASTMRITPRASKNDEPVDEPVETDAGDSGDNDGVL